MISDLSIAKSSFLDELGAIASSLEKRAFGEPPLESYPQSAYFQGQLATPSLKKGLAPEHHAAWDEANQARLMHKLDWNDRPENMQQMIANARRGANAQEARAIAQAHAQMAPTAVGIKRPLPAAALPTGAQGAAANAVAAPAANTAERSGMLAMKSLSKPTAANAVSEGGHVAMQSLAKTPASLRATIAEGARKGGAMSNMFRQALSKVAAELTEASRDKIAPKNFALSAKQSDTGKPAYPIEDKHHAANALARVKQFGDSKERAEVYADVARKYPGLAAKSSVPALRAKEKDSNMGGAESYGAAPLPSSFQAPSVGGSMKMGAWMEVFKEAGVAGALGKMIGPETAVGAHLGRYGHQYDLAGLGILAAPSAHNLAHQARVARQGGPVDKKEVGHSIAEIGGLGVLAAPVAAAAMAGRH